MKKFINFTSVILITFLILSCKKVEVDIDQEFPGEAPSVETLSSSSITTTSAILTGSVLDSNDADITEYGFCWSSTKEIPLVDDNKVSTVGSKIGNYSKSITSLEGSTKYYFRAYARNKFGITYGDVMNFTTLKKPSIFSAKINGVAYNATDIAVLSITDTGKYDIGGALGLKIINLNITKNATIGTHPLLFNTDYEAFYINDFNQFKSTSGSINITTFNKTSKNIAGTFNFVGKDTDGNSVSVTEGNFNVYW